MKPARMLFATVLTASALSLAACQAEKDPAPAASSAPDAKPGLAVSEARLVLPAVSGNPGAAYFTLANQGSGTAALAAVSIDGAAKAEMHQTQGNAMTPVDRVDVAPGTSISFEPGKMHVMAFELDPKLKAGSSTEMTLTFADGDKISAQLKIEAAGAAAMGGMDMQH